MRISDWSSDVCSSDLAFLVAEGQIVPGLVAELLRIASGGDAFIIKTDSAGIRALVIAGVEVPTDRHGRLWVHYANRRPQVTVSAKEALAGELASQRLADKLALIGTPAVGPLDIKEPTLKQKIPG